MAAHRPEQDASGGTPRDAFAFRRPFRSDPSWTAELGFRAHLLSIFLVVAGCVTLGVSISALGYVVQLVSEGTGAAMIVVGGVLALSVLVMWLGQFPGAVVLDIALRIGWGGWAVAVLGGLVVGSVLTVLVDTPLPQILGPVLGFAQWAALRFVLHRKSLPRV